MTDKVEKAIMRLQTASLMSQQYYDKPLMITYSGGKDSDCVLELAKLAKIPIEIVNSHTTADAPETVRHIQDKFRNLELQGYDCKIIKPTYKGKTTSMWNLIADVKMFPPTRLTRYCCDILKETSGNNRTIVTGVRWEESTKRKERGIYDNIRKDKKDRIVLNNDNDDKRRLFERCEMKSKVCCNPIIDWTTQEVFEFLAEQKVELNPLYSCGFNRVGCIGCSMISKKRYTEFEQYPQYKKLYIHAFDRMLINRKRKGKLNTDWQTGEDVFRWWMCENPNQLRFEDFEYKE